MVASCVMSPWQLFTVEFGPRLEGFNGVTVPGDEWIARVAHVYP